jgi:signal transduction histidine kinase
MDSAVSLDVQDDGRGFSSERACLTRRHGGGFGLESMREQVGRLGGSLAIERRVDGGSTVAIVIPTSRVDEGRS